jgi:signal transduction histidine kinase
MEKEILEYMLELSRRMAETRNLSPLLDYAMREALKLMKAERGFVVLLKDGDALDFRVTLDRAGKQLDDAQDQISESILRRVIRTRQPVVIEDALADPGFGNASSVATLKLRSVMCVPLISRGVTLGAIYVENRTIPGIFSEKDLPLLTFFAAQAAVAVENALLNDNLEALVAARTAELKRAMSHLRQSWTEAVEANRLRTVFLGEVAHDLRAPLALAATALHALLEEAFGDLNADQQEWIGKALDSTDHAIALTQDMFDLTKIDMGQLSLDKQNVALTTFLQETYKLGADLPWPEGVSFKADLPPDLPSVPIDPTRIRQVLLNLFTNALKFTTEGSVTLHAHRLADEPAVLISVADTGPGIPQDKLGLVFKPFQQFDTDPARRKKGTGLGLAICRELVGMHKGRIWVESQEGKGAAFKFVLPLAEAPADESACR